MSKFIPWTKRGMIYLLGLFIIALGVSVSKMSDLGVSPVNSIPCVISEISGIDMGLCVTGIFIVFIFIQLCILRKEFKAIYWFEIICSMMFGWFVSITNQLSEALLQLLWQLWNEASLHCHKHCAGSPRDFIISGGEYSFPSGRRGNAGGIFKNRDSAILIQDVF